MFLIEIGFVNGCLGCYEIDFLIWIQDEDGIGVNVITLRYQTHAILLITILNEFKLENIIGNAFTS